MPRALYFPLILAAFLIVLWVPNPAQDTLGPLDKVPAKETETRLPNGKLQSDEILKSEREQSLKDIYQMAELVRMLQKDFEQENSQHVLSIADIHRTEEIEKLAKRIRSRIRRY